MLHSLKDFGQGLVCRRLERGGSVPGQGWETMKQYCRDCMIGLFVDHMLCLFVLFCKRGQHGHENMPPIKDRFPCGPVHNKFFDIGP